MQARQLINELHEDLDIFYDQTRNIAPEQCYKKLKNNLTDEEALIHMDFSKSFITQYGQKIQPLHIGGSHLHTSPHTFVMYLRDSCTVCTISSHSSVSIWTSTF